MPQGNRNKDPLSFPIELDSSLIVACTGYSYSKDDPKEVPIHCEIMHKLMMRRRWIMVMMTDVTDSILSACIHSPIQQRLIRFFQGMRQYFSRSN